MRKHFDITRMGKYSLILAVLGYGIPVAFVLVLIIIAKIFRSVNGYIEGPSEIGFTFAQVSFGIGISLEVAALILGMWSVVKKLETRWYGGVGILLGTVPILTVYFVFFGNTQIW